jgi:hypothetical protein
MFYAILFHSPTIGRNVVYFCVPNAKFLIVRIGKLFRFGNMRRCLAGLAVVLFYIR